MARPLYASFLPTIKCSNCGVEIEISAMGDHLCTGTPDDASSHIGRSDHDRIPASYLQPPGYQGPSISFFDTRAPLSRDPNSTRGVGLGLQPLDMRISPAPSPVATTPSTDSLPSTLVSPASPRPAPPLRNAPVRSATDPTLTQGRRPSSPLAQLQNPPLSNYPAPTSLTRPNAPNHLPLQSIIRGSPDPNIPHGPVSPAINSGANVIKRMNSITPGPFNARSRSYGENNGPLSPRPGPAGRTSPSESRITSSATSFSPVPGQTPQPPSRPGMDEPLHDKPENANDGSVRPTFPMLPAEISTKPAQGAQSSVMPQQQANEELAAEAIAPLPRFSQSNRGHSLSESESSTASRSVSDSRTASSTSSHSPVMSNASSGINYKLSMEPNYYSEQRGEPASPPDPSMDPVPEAQGANGSVDTVSARPTMRSAQSSYSSFSSGLDRSSKMSGSQSLIDGGQRLSSLRYDPNVANGRASGPLIAAPRSWETKRRPAASKGKCRGCEKPIVGKSIKAADGRLSGRWHRECFMCQTCKAQFQTADFYVLNDQPYCAHDYHVLNGSLCHKCDKGIEGKYLETQPSHKYHQECFTCHDCNRLLTKDYFEMNQQFYCEADAFRVWQKSKSLTPGRRFPERRTTRLMMMA